MKRLTTTTILKLIVSTILVIIATAFIIGTDGCETTATQNNADGLQAAKTQQLMSEAQRQIGMPNIVNFQQRKLMKMVYELCDKENLVCYAYTFNEMKGTLHFIGKCVGFGLPYSAQYTNPSRIWDGTLEGTDKYYDAGEIQVIPQPDPNGLFMPTSSSATWLMMIDPETNKPHPVYTEPQITVSPFKLKGKHVIY